MKPPAVIRVTQDHIADGSAGCGDACPIALAIVDQWDGGGEYAWVTEGTLLLRIDSDHAFTAETPPQAAEFIEAFDADRPVEPFEFGVEWIDQDGVGA